MARSLTGTSPCSRRTPRRLALARHHQHGVGRRHDHEIVGSDDGVIRVKATERKSNMARTLKIKRTLFEANEYRQLARVHVELPGRVLGGAVHRGRARRSAARRRAATRRRR